MDDGGVGVPVTLEITFSPLYNIKTGSGAHPVLLSNGYRE
jgi:hypothetical protein